MRFFKLLAVVILSCLLIGCFSRKPDLFKMAIETEGKYLTLEQLQKALKDGADIKARNDLDETFLGIMAMNCPDPKAISLIIAAGVDVNDARNGGFTPLMRAANFNPNIEVMKVLLDAGANINARNRHGATALMCAADEIFANSDAMVFLLEHGADPDIKDNRGATVLAYVMKNERLKGSKAAEMILTGFIRKKLDENKKR